MTDLSPPLIVDAHWNDSTATVVIEGEIDLTTVDWLAESLGAVVAKRPSRLVLDLAELAFVDCAGARAISLALRALPAECPVIMLAVRPVVRTVFSFTGLASAGSGGSEPWHGGPARGPRHKVPRGMHARSAELAGSGR